VILEQDLIEHEGENEEYLVLVRNTTVFRNPIVHILGIHVPSRFTT